MIEADADQLVLTLQESFPRYVLGGRETKNYRELFTKFETGAVASAIKVHLETSPAPVFSELRALIRDRTPLRSDYQQQSRRERAEYEKEAREKSKFFSSLPPEDLERRGKLALDKLDPSLRTSLQGRAPAESKFLSNLIFAEEQSRRSNSI